MKKAKKVKKKREKKAKKAFKLLKRGGLFKAIFDKTVKKVYSVRSRQRLYFSVARAARAVKRRSAGGFCG